MNENLSFQTVLADTLEDGMVMQWQRRSAKYGGLLGPWIGDLESPARRLCLLVSTCLALTLAAQSREWTAGVDFDINSQDGPPTAIILDNGWSVRVLPVEFTGRLLRLDGEDFPLASARAGGRIVETLASRAATWFAAPAGERH